MNVGVPGGRSERTTEPWPGLEDVVGKGEEKGGMLHGDDAC